MVTADSVKTKLQGLIDKANTATGNSDTDLTAAVTALVDGYGQGGGSVSGGYCNIECYYRTGSDPSFYNTLKEVLQSVGANPSITFEVVDALPQSPNESDFVTFSVFNVYIYNDVPYVYGNAGAGNMWLGLTDLMAAQGVTGVTAKGFTFNIESETEEGIYVTYDEISEKGCDKLRNKLAQTYAKYASDSELIEDFIRGSIYNVDLTDRDVTHVGGFAHFDHLATITLPKTAYQINDDAFRGCYALKTINGTESITFIGDYAFEYCSELKGISLGVGLTHIGEYAFANFSINHIDYNGTKAQWKEIKKYTAWQNASEFIVYCTDGTITYHSTWWDGDTDKITET